MPARPTFDDIRRWYREERARCEAAESRNAEFEAALREIERQSDEAITTCDDDECLCCAAMDDIDRRVAAALALTEGGS